MNKTATELITRSENWLRHDVMPLWMDQGIDATSKGFNEALSVEGKALNLPRRALVQARQIYSFQTAVKLNLADITKCRAIVTGGTNYLINHYLQPDGSFIHAVTTDGTTHNADKDLYTQAFALFALACGFEVTRNETYKKHALNLLKYLNTHRQAPGGGFTEIKSEKIMYQSNPHMHLFEAALMWMQIDQAREWKELTAQLFELCHKKFIDSKSGALCEHFNEGWVPQLEANGHFIFEPGHHYEWAWLMSWYQDISGVDSKALRHSIYALADKYGINSKNLAVDEVYSDFSVKKSSSRFWPQCERIKAAVKLGSEAPIELQPNFAKSADQALTALFGYFNLPVKGLWQDMILENEEFSKQDPKASSLYHIINAMYEYTLIRPKIKDGV